MPPNHSTDEFVTSTLVAITKIGDYLATIEDGLVAAKEGGLAQIDKVLGPSLARKRFSQTTRDRFDNDLSRAFRYSAVILIYTTFESRGRLFQEKYETANGSSPKNPKGGSFVDGLQYSLENHSRPVVLDRSKIWECLSEINIVRNSIAHAAGLLRHSSRKSELKRIVSASADLDFDMDGYLVVASAFPFRACDLIYTFFNLLFSAAGFRLDIPEAPAEQFAKQFHGFEDQIKAGINEYYAKKGI